MVDSAEEQVKRTFEQWLPTADFEAIVQHALAAATTQLTNQTALPPRLTIIHLEEKQIHLTTAPVRIGVDRHQYMAAVGKALGERGYWLLGLVLVTEAWLKRFDDPAAAQRHLQGSRPVRDYEDKQEAVIAAGLTIDNRSQLIQQRIDRDAHGHLLLDAPAPLSGARSMILESAFAGYREALQTQMTAGTEPGG